MKKISILLLIIFVSINSSGCLRRSLTIRSNPPGATAYFNDEEVGATPVEFDFMWYHKSHMIRLEKEGFETLRVRESIKPPRHLWVPFDLFAEILPVKVEDYHEFSYKMVPQTSE